MTSSARQPYRRSADGLKNRMSPWRSTPTIASSAASTIARKRRDVRLRREPRGHVAHHADHAEDVAVGVADGGDGDLGAKGAAVAAQQRSGSDDRVEPRRR